MRQRGFEKIKIEQFEKDLKGNDCNYEEIKLPKRATKHSAGYDIYSLFDFKIEPNEIVKIPTGIKSYMKEDEVLKIFVRSGAGFKYNVRLCNQVGIIDSDYYSNEKNDGHIWIAFHNQGNKTWEIKKGEGIAQGLFEKFLVIDDDVSEGTRKGGMGSTNK